MKKLILWTAAALLLMVGGPWAAVTFAADAGMAVCFLLFFAADPVFCAVAGAFAGQDIRRLWAVPLIAPAAFLTGTWLFFEMAEPAFVIYSGVYLLIGTAAMGIGALIKKHTTRKTGL